MRRLLVILGIAAAISVAGPGLALADPPPMTHNCITCMTHN